MRRNCRQVVLCAAARGGSAAVSAPAAPSTPRRGYPGRGARPGSAGSPSLVSPAPSARSAPRAWDRPAADRPVSIGPSPADQPPVPAQQRIRHDSRFIRMGLGSRRASAAIRTVSPVELRLWGSVAATPQPPGAATSSPASFDAAERASSTIHPARRAKSDRAFVQSQARDAASHTTTVADEPAGQRPMPRFGTHRAAGRATMLVRAADGILGTHSGLINEYTRAA